jgi:hypothetical protein
VLRLAEVVAAVINHAAEELEKPSSFFLIASEA